jgi:AraC-like DNA-binding protein
MSLASSPAGASRNTPRSSSSSKPAAKAVLIQRSAITDGVNRERVDKIFDMLRTGKAPTLSDLAAELNLSKSHLQHLFKREAGLPLGHLLGIQRLQIAAQLLSHTNMRIKEIASATGYGHTSSFIRAFERCFDQAPQLYRRNWNRRTKS